MQNKRNNAKCQDLKNQKEESPLINQFVLLFKAIVIGRIKTIFSAICLEGPMTLMNVALYQNM